VKKIVAAAGLPPTWGQCETCAGEGIDPAVKDDHDAWTATEPPEGPGYQVWETTSEGSPISPVFTTPEELAAWMAAQYPEDANAEQWMKFITGPGWAPSFVADEHGFRPGVAAC